MTPPSELIRPPSKAAVIFLRWTTGKQNGRRLSSVMGGVACLDPGKGWLQQPNPRPNQEVTLLPPSQIPPRHEYDGLNSAGSKFGCVKMKTTAPEGFDVAAFYEGIKLFQSWDIFPGVDIAGNKPVHETLRRLGFPCDLRGAR